MKKITGWMAVLVAGAALAMPAMARDRDDYCAPENGYVTTYTVVRHDGRDVRDVRGGHEVRRDVRTVRDNYGRR